MTRLLVLYEDSLRAGTNPSQFLPHLILQKCLLDDGEDPSILRRLEAYPLNGASKLLKYAERPNNSRLIAVLDHDKLRLELKLQHDVPEAVVMAKLKTRAPSVQFVLLRENLETLVEAVCTATGIAVPTSKPKAAERDDLLKRALSSDRRIRDDVRRMMPSVDTLVAQVRATLAELATNTAE
jgi:hypothetical protein